MPLTTLSERLTELRAMLPLDKTAPVSWFRSRLARATQLSPAVVTKLETHGTGTAASLVALLQFYQAHGFNSNWAIAQDNAQECSLLAEMGAVSFEQVEAYGALGELRAQLHSAVAGPGMVTGMDGQALSKLLTHAYQELHEILTLLLPPIRPATWVANFNYHQLLLPPVPAKASGWQQRSQRNPIFHYYINGSSVPRCGNPVCYLGYDIGPKNIISSTKCPDCMAQPDECSPTQP